MLDKTLAIILAEGGGCRLEPLTDGRAKPVYARELLAFWRAPNLGPHSVQIPLSTKASARWLEYLQSRAQRIHHARAAPDAGRRELVYRHR